MPSRLRALRSRVRRSEVPTSYWPALLHPTPPFQEEKMNRFSMLARRFVKDDEAATMVEYALMLSLIAVVCIVAVTLIGTNAQNIFNTIAGALPGG